MLKLSGITGANRTRLPPLLVTGNHMSARVNSTSLAVALPRAPLAVLLSHPGISSSAQQCRA